MIQPHNGALIMVQELFDTPQPDRTASCSIFAPTRLDNTQTAEINIMKGLLQGEDMNSPFVATLSAI